MAIKKLKKPMEEGSWGELNTNIVGGGSNLNSKRDFATCDTA